MNALEAMLTDTSKDIIYENLSEVEYDSKGKPTRSWMHEWDQEARTEKFFDFCRAYDMREDSMLKENYQQLSHRLHWHECPFVDVVRDMTDPFEILNACVLFSFTNEHWQTFTSWLNGKKDGLRQRFEEGHRHSRSDLFQIYYPKDTKVSEWLIEAPEKTARDMHHVLGAKNRPYTMMEFAKILNKYFVEVMGFRNAMYPSKNAARHVAMSHPEWVDPDSFLHGGTGFFDGLVQVFDCDHLMSKAKYEIDEFGKYIPTNKSGMKLLEMMDYLHAHPSNPMHTHKYLNIEDKLCMHFKYMSMRFGNKKQTKQIPYEWVYPKEWSLKTGKYDRLN
jgi:hypothetical protein